MPRHSPAVIGYRGHYYTTSKQTPTIYRWVPQMDLAIDSRQVELHLSLLNPDGQGFVEIRYGAPPNRQEWFGRLNEKSWRLKLFDRVRQLADRDLYVGAAVRARKGGTKADVLHSQCVWVDADTAESQKALAGFEPKPTLLLSSGGGRHGWWRLNEPVPGLAIENPLRRLGTAIGGDLSVADAARVMRLAGAYSHKYGEPRRVQILEHDPNRIYTLAEVLAGAPPTAPQRFFSPTSKGEETLSWAPDERPPVRLDAEPHHGEGRRHTTLRAWIALLVNRFPDQPKFVLACSLGLNEHRLRPPKPEREVEQLVQWVFKQHWGLRGD